MLVREMQVDQSVLQPGMPKQKLNSTEIGTGFQHVSRTTMAQRMWTEVFGDARRSGSMLTRQPHHVGSDGHVGAYSFHRPRKQKGCGLHPAPVDAQGLQSSRAQRNVSVTAAFALANPNHHALAVDVLNLQLAQFGTSHARGIKCVFGKHA